MKTRNILSIILTVPIWILLLPGWAVLVYLNENNIIDARDNVFAIPIFITWVLALVGFGIAKKEFQKKLMKYYVWVFILGIALASIITIMTMYY
ncbi:hypothetical protein HOD29_02775 [archaeon]|jgi:hypothetical protein|nr:hypothetical protein [archaeon]